VAETGRVALFRGAGTPFELSDLPVPDPEPGAIIARLEYTSICGSDAHYWRGEDPVVEGLARQHGLVLGHETVGRVHALGDGVIEDALGHPLAEGDPVVFAYFRPCWDCRTCRLGRPHTCQTAMLTLLRLPTEPPHFTGAFADFYHLPAGAWVLRLPDGMEPADAIGANCAVAQTTFALRRAGLQPDERVVIQGAGGLGLYAVAAARRMGAETIVAVDAVADRLDAASRLGATHVLDVSEVTDSRERVERVREMTGGGADVVMEVAGVPGVVAEGILMLERGGRYLELGQIVRGGDRIELPALALLTRNLSLTGVALYDPRVLEEVVDMLAELRGDPTLERLTRGRAYPLEQLDRAFEELAGHSDAVRPVIQLSGGAA